MIKAVSIPEELNQKVIEFAAKHDLKQSALIRLSLKAYMNKEKPHQPS